MKFIGYTKDSCRVVCQVEDVLNRQDDLLQQSQLKVNRCPYQVHLIGGNPPLNYCDGKQVEISKTIHALHEIWSGSWKHITRDESLSPQAVELLQKIGQRVTATAADYNGLIYKFREGLCEQGFFIFLREEKQLKLPMFELIYLSQYWQLESGHFALHASAVIHRGGIYLFSGPSGSGKSTVAGISAGYGDEILDQDMVSVYHSEEGFNSANAWGYSITTCSLPIRAFYYLVKDVRDDIKPLSKSHTARLVWEQSAHIPGPALPQEKRNLLFSRTAEFSRSIPGYELHFRKSPDFWKLIDAEIPCE